jgi:hypothetical protein
MQVGSHLHGAPHALLGVRLGLSTALLIRPPRDAVLSLLVRPSAKRSCRRGEFRALLERLRAAGKCLRPRALHGRHIERARTSLDPENVQADAAQMLIEGSLDGGREYLCQYVECSFSCQRCWLKLCNYA